MYNRICIWTVYYRLCIWSCTTIFGFGLCTANIWLCYSKYTNGSTQSKYKYGCTQGFKGLHNVHHHMCILSNKRSFCRSLTSKPWKLCLCFALHEDRPNFRKPAFHVMFVFCIWICTSKWQDCWRGMPSIGACAALDHRCQILSSCTRIKGLAVIISQGYWLRASAQKKI